MRYLAGIFLIVLGGASLFLDRFQGPASHPVLPIQMAGLGMAIAGLAVCFRRPQVSAVYASAWKRVLASLIDWTLVSLVTLPVGWFDDNLPFGFFLPLFTLETFLFVLMSVFCHARWGMTPGKYLLKIRVVRADFSPIGFREAGLRSSVDAVFAALLVAKFIRYVWLFGYPEYQGVMGGDRTLDITLSNPWYILLITGLNNMWYMLEVAVMMWNGKRRAPHDFIAGTVMVTGRGNG